MTRTEIDDLIALLIDDNNANQIDYARVKTVLTGILNSVLGIDIANIDGAIPFVEDGQYTASTMLRVIAGVLASDKLRLKYGISEADRIHLSGLLTVADQKKALATVYYVSRSNKVDVIIGPAINIADLQAGMTTKSADGEDIALTDGMQVLLKNQTDASENGVFIVKTAEAPEVPDWYDSTKNQSIEVLTGSVSKVDLPAVPEGEAPVIAVDNGELAFQLFLINNL